MTTYCSAGKIILVLTAIVRFACPGMYDMNNNKVNIGLTLLYVKLFN